MKKIFNLFVVTLAILLFNFANALEIVDVTSDYWASQEIVHALQNGYLGVVDGNKFNPEGTITRNEFVTSLLKVIGRQDEGLTQKTTYKDIKKDTKNARNVVLSEQIQMSFGYPDKTFRPYSNIDHNETMSMIANITNGDYVASDISSFADYEAIPIWARRAYIKNVANDIYVNHPDESKFTPARDLTRAEAAVLFDKVSKNLAKVKSDYKDLAGYVKNHDFMDDTDNDDDFYKSKFLSTQTLDVADFATNNKVQIYDNKKIIEAGNILIGTNLGLVKTRKDLVGYEYVFSAPEDLYTKEGTFVFPKGTEFYARVDKIGYSAWRSKPEKSRVVFHKYSLPTGETYDMAGVPFTKKDKVVYVNSLKKSKKMAFYDGKNQKLINYAHQKAPLTEYEIKDHKTIYILITGDTIIPLNSNYLNLRTEKSLLERL